MARTATSRNLFGLSFGRKETVLKSHGTTRSQVKAEAFRAGQKSGDTGLFDSWARSKKLHAKWDRDSIREFERSYREGVDRGEEIERRAEAKKEKTEAKREAVRAQKTELAETVKEVTEALVAQGMKKGQASKLSRTKYRKGDSFEDLWRRVVQKENPEAPSQLAKKGWRLVDRFATRGAAAEVSQKYGPYRLIHRGDKWEVWTQQRGNPSMPEQMFSQGLGYLPYGSIVRDAGKSVLKKAKQNPKGGKFDRCVQEVSKRGGVKSPHAICQASVGRENNGSARRNPSSARKAKRSKNPLDEAQQLYRHFTGLEPTEIVTTTETEHFHQFRTRYGTLVCLDILTVDGREIPLIAKGFVFEPKKYLARDIRHSDAAKDVKASWYLDPKTPKDKLVRVEFSEDGKQMLFTGGDQSIPWKDLGLTDRDQRDQMFIGTIVEITYRAKKRFELEGKDEVDFHHPFGAQGSRGIMPILCYLDRTKRMVTFGGRYETAPVRKDIGASPGIVG